MSVDRPLFGLDEREMDRRTEEQRAYKRRARDRGLVCPQCGGKSGVIDSRPDTEGIRRRRQCERCRSRFSTVEVVVGTQQAPGIEQPTRDVQAAAKTMLRRMLKDLNDGGEPPPAEPAGEPAADARPESLARVRACTCKDYWTVDPECPVHGG